MASNLNRNRFDSSSEELEEDVEIYSEDSDISSSKSLDESDNESDNESDIENEIETNADEVKPIPNEIPIGKQKTLKLYKGQELIVFIRLTPYHIYDANLDQTVINNLSTEIINSQQVPIMFSAISLSNGETYIIDDVYYLMALRKLSDIILDKLEPIPVMFYNNMGAGDSLEDPECKILFNKLAAPNKLVINPVCNQEITRFCDIIQSDSICKKNIKTQTGKVNFPYISLIDIQKTMTEVLDKLKPGTYDIEKLAERFLAFNIICRSKSINTLFGMSPTDCSESQANKLKARYYKMKGKEFYLASPYGQLWKQYILGKSDTEIQVMSKKDNVFVPSTKLSIKLKI